MSLSDQIKELVQFTNGDYTDVMKIREALLSMVEAIENVPAPPERNYEVEEIEFLLTQSGTNAPVITYITANPTRTISLGYENVGTYAFGISGPNSDGRIMSLIMAAPSHSEGIPTQYGIYDNREFAFNYIQTFANGQLANNQLWNTYCKLIITTLD